MWGFLRRTCWEQLDRYQKGAALFGMFAPMITGALTSNYYFWSHGALLSFAFFALVVAWHCAEKAHGYEEEQKPKLDVSARVYNNTAQLIVKNISSKTVDDVEVKVVNQRMLGQPGSLDAQMILVSTDKRASPVSIHPRAPMYFTFSVVLIDDEEKVTFAIGPNAEGVFGPAMSNPVVLKTRVSGREFEPLHRYFQVGKNDKHQLSIQPVNAHEAKRADRRIGVETSSTG